MPADRKSGFVHDRPKQRRRIDLLDLISAGLLTPGMSLHPRQAKHADKVATLLHDGRVEIDGQPFSSASSAAVHLVGAPTNGWWFFLAQQTPRRSLDDVRRDYLHEMAIENDGDEQDEQGDN
ncbi:MAG: hypothetical protein KDI32_05740 [Pseudomonadales bacterium]|nr:hypothetical protein [Pseudomonadales bacterium]